MAHVGLLRLGGAVQQLAVQPELRDTVLQEDAHFCPVTDLCAVWDRKAVADTEARIVGDAILHHGLRLQHIEGLGSKGVALIAWVSKHQQRHRQAQQPQQNEHRRDDSFPPGKPCARKGTGCWSFRHAVPRPYLAVHASTPAS